MYSDIQNGKINLVIVKDQSRLGRDYLQTGLLMEITFPQYDVRFIAVNDGVDSINGVSDFAGIKNYFNDLYARDTSKKIRAVQRAKGERGERVGATIPYGYMKSPDDPKQIVPDPETSPTLTRRSLTARPSSLFRSTLREENAPTSRAKSTSIPGYCIVVSAGQGSIFTERKR